MFKKIAHIFATVLLVFGLSGCSKINAIEQAFVSEGYTWRVVAEVDNDTKDAGVKAIYSATKGLTGIAIIVELQGSQEVSEVVAAIKEDPNFDGDALLKTLIDAYNGSPITNGNCFIITITRDALDIFQNA